VARRPAIHPSVRQLFTLNDLFSRTAAGIYSKLGTHVPYGVPTKCCYVLNRFEI